MLGQVRCRANSDGGELFVGRPILACVAGLPPLVSPTYVRTSQPCSHIGAMGKLTLDGPAVDCIYIYNLSFRITISSAVRCARLDYLTSRILCGKNVAVLARDSAVSRQTQIGQYNFQ